MTTGDWVKILNGKFEGKIGLIIRAQITILTINVENHQIKLKKNDVELIK